MILLVSQNLFSRVLLLYSKLWILDSNTSQIQEQNVPFFMQSKLQ